jgi:hypothetical protein
VERREYSGIGMGYLVTLRPNFMMKWSPTTPCTTMVLPEIPGSVFCLPSLFEKKTSAHLSYFAL